MLPTTHLPDHYQPAADCLNDHVILVTGAGQGIGRLAAMEYARHGATVVLHGRNVPKLEAVYDEIEVAGLPQAAILPLDFAKSTQADLDGLARVIYSTFNRLDGILHGASHFVSTMPLDLHDLDAWQLHTKVNLAVPIALTKSCMPMLKRSTVASVVFLTETHAISPKAYWGAYAVSKSALASAVAIWQQEFDTPSPIRFNLFLPGPVASPMRAQSHPGETSTELPEMASLGDSLIYLIGPDSRDIRGQLLLQRQKHDVGQI